MLVEKAGSVYLSVRVIPNSRYNKIVGWQGNNLKIKIAVPAAKGRANKELIKFLASKLDVDKSAIEIVHGISKQKKIIIIFGISIKDLRIE